MKQKDIDSELETQITSGNWTSGTPIIQLFLSRLKIRLIWRNRS